MSKTGVVITDGNERSALAVVRSLGRRGIPVYVGAETVSSLAGASIYASGSFVYPSPWQEPTAYVDTLLATVAQRQVAAIFPMTDIAMELIGERISEFERLTELPVPSLAQYHQLSDKYLLTKWAEKNHVPVPPTIYVPDGHIENVLPQIGHWPVVIKPGRSLLKSGGRWQKSSVMIARDADDLRKSYHDHWFLNQPSLVQQYVEGRGEGVFGLFVNGKPTTLFAHRRLRERPPSGGVSVLRESIALPEPMTTYATHIMKEAEWTGVAMVEFKVDPISQIPYLMEVNGRFWGSLQLAVDAGVDFPWLLYQHACGMEGDETKTYTEGVRSRWWIGDLDHFLSRVRDRGREAHLPPGSISRLRTLISLLNVFDTRTKGEVLRLSDLRPGILELGRFARLKAGAVTRKLAQPWRTTWRAGKEIVADATLRSGYYRTATNRRLPNEVNKILVLCKGNVCRSPFAEEWLRDAISRRGLQIELSSAGLNAIEGREAYPIAKTVAPQFELHLDRHRARQVTRQMIAEADIILVMERSQSEQVATQFPEAHTKTFLLGQFSSKQPVTTISDPYGGTAEVFVECFQTLKDACQGFLSRIGARATKVGPSN